MVDYKKERIDDFIVYKISGEFVICHTGDVLDDYTKEIQSGRVNFIFDFQKTKVIDSSGLGTVLTGVSQILEHNKKIRICFDINNVIIKELFSMVNLNAVMDYYGSLEDALKGQNPIIL